MQSKFHLSLKYITAGILLASIVPLAALVALAAPLDQDGAVCATEYTVQAGDSLSVLAVEYLGSRQAFPAIVEATNQKNAVDNTFANITDPASLEIGWVLCIPNADAAAMPVTEESTPAETASPAAEMADEADGWAPDFFAAGAFPPPFPVDTRHDDTWFSEDCQTCHEKQIDDAPTIPHDLWTTNCRSCHVPSTQALEPAVGDWAPSAFASGAFPPPYPVDTLHGDAWFNETCQTCHETETDGATAIPHDIWSQNCRSCHLPGVQEDAP